MPFSQSESLDILFPMKTPFVSPSSESQLALLRRTITAHLTDDESRTVRSGLRTLRPSHPFARHIYPTQKKLTEIPKPGRAWDRFSAEATIDGLAPNRRTNGQVRGDSGPEWCAENAAGEWKDIWTSNEPPVGCRESESSEVTFSRSGARPCTQSLFNWSTANHPRFGRRWPPTKSQNAPKRWVFEKLSRGSFPAFTRAMKWRKPRTWNQFG